MSKDDSIQEALARINERLEYLEFALRDQIARIYAIEQKVGIAPPLVKEPPPAPPVAKKVEQRPPIVAQAEPPPIVIKEVKTDDKAGAMPPPAPTEVQRLPPLRTGPDRAMRPAPERDFEAIIGGTWFNRIGIFAIILSVGFFLREAFRRGWIGPLGRVAIGVAIGIGLLIAGDRIRARGYRSYAQSLFGGGIAILYLTFFAAFALYSLIGQLPAFLLMSLVTATAVLLSARYDALVIAILGLIGGFLTPILLSTGHDNETGLFTYIALLDAGVLALAYFKQWRLLNYLAFGATVLLAAAWTDEWYRPEKLRLTIFFFTLFFLIFALIPIFHNVIKMRLAAQPDISLIFSNASIYFASCYGLLNPGHRSFLGLFALLLSAFYLGLGYFAHSRHGRDRYLTLTYLGLAMIFMTLAVPIQFNQDWVTMSWAAEGAVLTWIGVKADNRATRYAAITVFSIAVFHWLVVDLAKFGLAPASSFTPFFNRRGLSAVVLIASFAIAARFYSRLGSTIKDNERSAFIAAYLLVANFLALVWLSADLGDYFDQAIAQLPPTLGNNPHDTSRGALSNSKEFALSTLVTVYGLAGLIIGITRNSRALRLGALGLLFLATTKLLSVDITYSSAVWHLPILNQTFMSFAILVAALACGAWFYSRAKGLDEEERTLTLTILVIVANLMAIVGLSAETLGYFDAKIQRENSADNPLQDLLLAKQLSLSVIWAVYGGMMLIVGIWRNRRVLRMMALGLLAITTFKVFLLDLASLDKIYRIISFIVLGVILLAVSFLYQKWQRRESADLSTR